MLRYKKQTNAKGEGSVCSVFYTGPETKKKKFTYLFPFFNCNGGQHPPECHAKYCRFLPSGVGGQLSPEYPSWHQTHSYNWIVRDFNNDGFADVFITFISNETQSIPFKLSIYDKNTGTYVDESYRIKENIGLPFSGKAVSADLNGDGILDMVAVSNPECPDCAMSYLDIVLSTSDSTWEQKRIKKADRFKNEGYYHGVAVGDIDNDGDIDIIVAGGGFYNEALPFINDGKGNFKENQDSKMVGAHTAELADINNDGCLDFFYFYNSPQKDNSGILYGDGSGTFGKVYQYFTPFNFKFSLVLDYDIVDFDEDGDMDLLLTTTDYYTGWELVFLENSGIDDFGRINWINHTEEISQSLKSYGFYTDPYSSNWIPRAHVVDINADGFLDIIPQAPLSNTEFDDFQHQVGHWILLGDGKWSFKYKNLPFAEPPKTIASNFAHGKVNLSWERVTQSYSTSDGGINKWAVYVSDTTWGDRSQVSKPLIVSANDTKSENGFDQLLLEPTSKEMYIRISPIDSTGIEWPLSKIHHVTINPPAITLATICDEKTLTLTGSNFVGVKSIQLGSSDVLSFNVLSESTIQAELYNGQTGNVILSTVAGSIEYSNVTFFTALSQPFSIAGKKTLISGSTETFSVPNVEGVSYTWVFPEGWQIIAGSNTNSVTVKVGTASGEIYVYPSVICGSLSPQNITAMVYTYVPDNNFQNALCDLGIDKGSKADSVLTSSLQGVSSLILEGMNIADLTGIQDFADLKILNCRRNQIKILDLTGNKLLEELFCGWNQLTSIDLSKNLALRILACEWNQISTLDISQNSMLNDLGCEGIPITNLDLSNNKELWRLSMWRNQNFKSIDLSNNTKLTFINCSECQLFELDVSKNVNLDFLNCLGNQFTSLDVSNNSALKYFDCSDNKLVNLNLKNGNNVLLESFFAQNNPKLTCISVDDPVQSLTYSDWKKDATASYSDECALVVPEPTITSFSPTTSCIGDTISITGTNFTGTTDVSFGGIPAAFFNVISSTSISAVAEDGSSGNISITTSGGTATKSGFKLNSLPSSAGTISGISIVSQGQKSVVYTVPAIANATSYIWTLPEGATGISTSNRIIVNYEPSASSGDIRVKGHNSCGDGSESKLAIFVDNPPVANAGTNQSTDEGQSVTLDGSASADPEGNSLTFNWTAPPGITLSSATTTKPTFVAPEVKNDTILNFSLIVNDGLINSLPSNVQVTVKNVIKTGMEDISRKNYAIYPNPSAGLFKIEGLSTNQKNNISVYSVDGRLINTKISNPTTETIDLSSHVSGVYLLFINNQSFKIIKQ